MLINPPPKHRRRGKLKELKKPTPPPAFALIAATFDAADPSVTLTFSWPIDIGGLDAGQILLWDNVETFQSYTGWSATLITPSSVKIGLEAEGSPTVMGIILNAGEDNGIRGADEGPVWNGVVDLELPFP